MSVLLNVESKSAVLQTSPSCPIFDGEADNSSCSESNRAISHSSLSLGKNNVAGVKGYYCNVLSTTTITLYSNQARNVTAPAPAGWVGKSISIVNDKKYDNISKVTSVSGNTLTVSPALPFSSLTNISSPNHDDYSIICIEAPDVGVVDFGMNSVFMFGPIRPTVATNTASEITTTIVL